MVPSVFHIYVHIVCSTRISVDSASVILIEIASNNQINVQANLVSLQSVIYGFPVILSSFFP